MKKSRIYVNLDEQDLDLVDRIKNTTKANSRHQVIEQVIHRMGPIYLKWWEGPLNPPSKSKPIIDNSDLYNSEGEGEEDIESPSEDIGFSPIKI